MWVDVRSRVAKETKHEYAEDMPKAKEAYKHDSPYTSVIWVEAYVR